MIHLEPVTPENWRCGLRVREDQHCFAADSAGLLARAYAYRAQRSEALVIYADNTPVGMALYYDLDELHAYNLSQLFIDARYQGRGYGTEAVRLLLQRLKTDGKFEKVVLCYVDGDEAAQRLYEALGFRPPARSRRTRLSWSGCFDADSTQKQTEIAHAKASLLSCPAR